MPRLLLLIGIASCAANAFSQCEKVSVRERVAGSDFVVLARVVETNFPSEANSDSGKIASLTATTRLEVIKSWAGPFSAGSLISAGPPPFATGVWPPPYPFHFGDEVLVFAKHYPRPWSQNLLSVPIDRSTDFLSWSEECWLMDKRNAASEMSILDKLLMNGA
jgi:hypothetical protein